MEAVQFIDIDPKKNSSPLSLSLSVWNNETIGSQTLKPSHAQHLPWCTIGNKIRSSHMLILELNHPKSLAYLFISAPED
jgi:hypothetical protein